MDGFVAHARTYLRRWVDWVDAGAPDGDPFYRDTGLCDGVPSCEADTGLGKLLGDTFGGGGFPFGGRHRFITDTEQRAMHLNKERVAWARKNALPKE